MERKFTGENASQGISLRMKNPSGITNKIKRAQVMAKFRKQKKQMKKEASEKRKREAEQLGDDAPPKQVPRTLESTREADDTTITGEDIEVSNDLLDDEFSEIYSNECPPKLMITTRPLPSGDLYGFIKELMDMIPNSFYYKRGDYDLKDICKYASNKKFSHLIVLSEKSKICNGAVISKLPDGPTAYFKISNVVRSVGIANHGTKTSHNPEIILNNFTTRLGHRLGRFLGSLFPHEPNFVGRQAVTFHNQRDYIFVRQHRYIFNEDGSKARLQELGPRFTMRLRWLQQGSFDTKFGEYEWIHKRKQMDTTRRRFHL